MIDFYRQRFTRRGGLRVEVHLPGDPKNFRWTRVVGVRVGRWFFGAVKGTEYRPAKPGSKAEEQA